MKWLSIMFLVPFLMLAVLDSADAAQAYREDGKYIILAWTKEGFKELSRMVMDGDDRAIALWIFNGHGWIAPTGTRLSILDESVWNGWVKVMVTKEGPDGNKEIIGNIGYTFTSFVKK